MNNLLPSFVLNKWLILMMFYLLIHPSTQANSNLQSQNINPFSSLLLKNKPSVMPSNKAVKINSSEKKLKSKPAPRQTLNTPKKVTKMIQDFQKSLPIFETKINIPKKHDTSKYTLKEVLDTSEGRYAFISDEKITYFIQEGEYFENMLVEKIGYTQVVLIKSDETTRLVLKLLP